MEVPQTPLHTARVLEEDKDHWDDVKVGRFCLSLYTFQDGISLESIEFSSSPVPGGCQ